MLVALQLVTVAGTVLSVTPPLPWVAPKFVPVMVNDEPKPPPAVGATLVIAGAAVTVNVTPLLATPPAAVTTTLPVTAPVGTVATMLVGLQLLTVAVVAPNLTPPLPCVGPKFAPVIVTTEPMAPELGARLVMLGAGVTVNVDPLLAWPPTVTTTGPVAAPAGTGAVIEVALQAVGVELTPLKVTVLLPWAARKLVPAITTEVATAPVFGVRLVIVGAGVPSGSDDGRIKIAVERPFYVQFAVERCGRGCGEIHARPQVEAIAGRHGNVGRGRATDRLLA